MRPLGVTLVGYYQILRGILGVLFGLSVLLFAGLAAKLASLAAEGNALEVWLRNLGHAAGLVVIIFGFVHMLAGYGVLQMQNWGRLITLLFSALGLIVVLPGLIHGNLFSVLFGFINGAVIIFLAMPPTKRMFDRPESRNLRMAA